MQPRLGLGGSGAGRSLSLVCGCRQAKLAEQKRAQEKPGGRQQGSGVCGRQVLALGSSIAGVVEAQKVGVYWGVKGKTARVPPHGAAARARVQFGETRHRGCQMALQLHARKRAQRGQDTGLDWLSVRQQHMQIALGLGAGRQIPRQQKQCAQLLTDKLVVLAKPTLRRQRPGHGPVRHPRDASPGQPLCYRPVLSDERQLQTVPEQKRLRRPRSIFPRRKRTDGERRKERREEKKREKRKDSKEKNKKRKSRKKKKKGESKGKESKEEKKEKKEFES